MNLGTVIPHLPVGHCQVWWARPSQARNFHVGLLDGEERDRRAAYRQAVDRDRFTVGCAVLRTVVGAQQGFAAAAVVIDRSCPDCDRPHGRPVPRGAVDLGCSVSHSGDHVLVSLARGMRVGVDVEAVDPHVDVDRLVGHVLTAAEAARWRLLPEPDRLAGFFVYWTRKEAILKAAGCGLRCAPTEITVSAPDEPPRLLTAGGSVPLVPGQVQLHDLTPREGHVASLASLHPDGRAPLVREFDAETLLTDHAGAPAR